ncbi:efflux RND transporter permease subunit [Roseicyclus sp. F158]|uniref:Efflux RND transporter permease subunit n=1 Tax=Tropicimonas omnivorans TaxID=3075590 RepID=A0ABU3DJI6_9RHOB|nr:efflux RND transporter permease subunit [Roseicyclus sp. F158]MDT0683888.1 efflux RND transporter permease subunit [Roseicyclus sp. F158]
MNAIIDGAFDRARVVALVLIGVLCAGAYAYITIPKESMPEVPIPVIYVVTTLEGISPEDAERLLVSPLETEMSSIEDVKQMEASAGEGYASVTLEFDAGFDAAEALDRVREAVDTASTELPEDATEPSVNEVNTALFPILTATLSGPVPERTLNRLAEDLQTRLESLAGVLEVDVGGERTELMEVLIDPTVFETYNISFEELINQINRNNRLIAAGAIENGAGRIVIKVPGLIENLEDVMELPIKVSGTTVVTFGDVATVRRTFEDPTSFARIGGQPALALEIKKRSGANIIETVEAAKEVIASEQEGWPDSVQIEYLQDESQQVRDLLSDLESNVITAIILVMVVIVWALGFRSSILVGLSIPGAFLAGVLTLYAMGLTMNIIVLFSLILVVGMLVDGAIVTTELADRKLMEGASPREAYSYAAKRMTWPIIASTMTTLSVFFPLLFWTGTVGEIMKFLPITVILTLSASLFMALIFIPVLGGLIGRRQPQTQAAKVTMYEAETGDPRRIGGITGAYVRVLTAAVKRPWATLLLAVALLVGAFTAYSRLGTGITFFPEIEPDFMQVEVRARDSFSIYERDALVREVENRLLRYENIESVYARTSADRQSDEEVIGTIQLELDEWDTRPTAAVIGERIREGMQDIPGIDVQVQTAQEGPAAGKPVNLQLSIRDPDSQVAVVEQVREAMEQIGGYTDVTDTLPIPGVEWRIELNRSEAARFGADVSLLGQAVQLLTQGITVAEYRPSDVDGSVDIRVRFPAGQRTLEELQSLRVPTSAGLIPIGNFVTFEPSPRTGLIHRIDQRRVVTIEADVAQGLLANDQINALRGALERMELPPGVDWSFGGEAEDQQESMIFLATAFLVAIVLMFAILLTQFNSFAQSVIVMTAIIFSVAGVLLGLLVTGRPFGIVMGGVGVIALAGIVVNNNIVLIDTYNELRAEGLSPMEAAIRSGAQRFRPVLLTSITTALGLMPMVFALSVDVMGRDVVYGAPSTQYWTELSSAIAGGLTVATVLTLVVTPAMLMLPLKKKRRAVRDGPLAARPQPCAQPAE